MPELPEVETVRRGLEMVLPGKRIKQVTLARLNLRIPFPPHFSEKLAGRRITSLERRGKYLLFMLSGGLTLIAHLGMTGRFTRLAATPDKLATHDHVLLVFEDGSALIFNDSRRFGLMTLAPTEELELHPLLARLGPEPLTPAFNAAYLSPVLAARKGAIKPALMDAGLVVGVGNIYASEALFMAKIDPRTPAYKVAGQAAAIAAAIRKVLKLALDSGGSSLKDFLRHDGSPGYFQHHFSVYGREGEKCKRCRGVIHMLRQAGRATYYCPQCQH